MLFFIKPVTFLGIHYSLDFISSVRYFNNHLSMRAIFCLLHSTEINHEKKINNLVGNTNMHASPHHQISQANMKLTLDAVVVKIYWE